MNDFSNAIAVAWKLVIGLDADLVEIVVLSLKISLSAVLIATVVALPLGAAIAVFRFPGRGACTVLLNALMGLPPVAVGLLIYLLLSRAGPLGEHGLLYTPAAMVIAQAVLVVPIIAALAQQILSELYVEYEEQLRSLGVSSVRAIPTLLWDGRFSLLIAVLAGFGRASAEVGAVIIVGGNINHLTRVMTTTITLETSKGNLAMALGLGLILVLIVILVNALTVAVRSGASRLQGWR
jgi:tungstate transport system permease protein